MLGLGLFASVFFGAGLAMGYFLDLRPWWLGQSSHDWTVTPCRILSSAVIEHPGKSTTYSIDITYRYQVAGQNFQSNRYDFTVGSTNDRDWREQVVQQDRAGTQTVCYVNPQNPAEAVLSRGYESNTASLIVPLVFSLVGLGMLTPVGFGAIRRMKFGESVFELRDAPVPMGGVLEGVVTLAKMIQPLEGFTVKLACIHRIVTGVGKSRKVQEIPLWDESKQITPEVGGGIPVCFALPENGTETSAIDKDDRIFWRLDVRAKMPGIGYKAQFEVPVVRAELSAEEAAEARKLRGEQAQTDEQFQLPGHSRIRVQETMTGKEFCFPAMRNVGMVVFMTLFLAFWTGVCWVLFHYHAPFIFPLFFGFAELVMLWSWAKACFGTSRVVAGNGQIELTKHLFGLGKTQTIPASEIREIKVSIGTTMGTQVYYNVKIVQQNGMTQTAGAEVADSHEAHWLALEMAKCAGVGE